MQFVSKLYMYTRTEICANIYFPRIQTEKRGKIQSTIDAKMELFSCNLVTKYQHQ